ncbi:lachesin-like [Portunus trituberculatus]|uniref:lachesin-like n=1 Tax=Portunus trituberculatus TaxID=210409 RepID=UPI001E1CD662|nr:lachesin-like [Portunus trituberculatus]
MEPRGGRPPYQPGTGCIYLLFLLPLFIATHTEGGATVAQHGVPRTVTTAVGQTAYLHCRVSDLGDNEKVSWIRQRDLHVMSSGRVVFASDQRFQVIHPEKSENWTLQIKFAQLRDAGVYECQVNTEPKTSVSYLLRVSEARAVLEGPEYVKAGSSINLTCYINQPHLQGLVYWYHEHEMLQYDGAASITTRGDESGVTSSLSVPHAEPRHAGNYTC